MHVEIKWLWISSSKVCGSKILSFWQDVSDIPAGEQWEQAIQDAIKQASFVLLFWTQSASNSPSVNKEIDHALEHNKTIIQIWLDKNERLHDKLKDVQAITSSGFSIATIQDIVKELLKSAVRIKREVTNFQPSRKMNDQSVGGITREVIGSGGDEFTIVPIVNSAYSSAVVIAKGGTIVSQVKRIQLIIQNTGPVSYQVVRQAFDAVRATDKLYPEGTEQQPLVALYVTGVPNPLDPTQFRVDYKNVVHYSDMVDTTCKAITTIINKADEAQTFQVFQKTLVEISFLLGVSLDRWIPLQLYKWDGAQYVYPFDIPPRIPN